MIRIQTIIAVIVKTVAVILIRILIGIIRLSEYNLSCHSHIVPPVYQNMASRTPESNHPGGSGGRLNQEAISLRCVLRLLERDLDALRTF